MGETQHIMHYDTCMHTQSILCYCLNPSPNNKFLDSSKLKTFADNNFTFDENDRKFSKRVKHTVGKGEIALYEKFLLFPLCFQKVCYVNT